MRIGLTHLLLLGGGYLAYKHGWLDKWLQPAQPPRGSAPSAEAAPVARAKRMLGARLGISASQITLLRLDLVRCALPEWKPCELVDVPTSPPEVLAPNEWLDIIARDAEYAYTWFPNGDIKLTASPI